MAMTKEQRIKVLSKGKLENGGTKPNRARQIAIDSVILNDLSEEFTFVCLEVGSAQTFKTYMYNRIRKDSILRKRSYSFRYMNPDGTEGAIVTASNGSLYGSPCTIKIIRNADKTEADMSMRDLKKRHKMLSKRAAENNSEIKILN